MARTSHALVSTNICKEIPSRISQESKTVINKIKDDLDADSEAKFG